MPSAKPVFRVLLAAAMVAAGTLHFADPEPFVRIVPPVLPYGRALVYVSGFFEILGGIGLLPERTRRAASWGLIALYVAVFPANIYMAVADVRFAGLPEGELLPWLRLPFQAVLIAWAWWVGRPDDAEREARRST